ncbi:MAG: translocation/assembly module TamB domain-containing protein [Saprospiraceae bacterium]
MKKYFQKGIKFLGITALVLVILFLLVFFLIRIPTVQTWLVQKATSSLSETLQTKVEIKAVDIEFFKTAVLEEIYIEDKSKDTLLFAQQLKADIGVFSIFQKEIFLNKIQLQGGNIQLSRDNLDSLFNYQFIIDKLNPPSSETSTEGTSTTTPWSFGIGNVLLENIKFDLKDEQGNGFDLNTKIGYLELNSNSFDLEKKHIDLSNVLLKESKIDYTVFKNKIEKSGESSVLLFPNFGWKIKSKQLELTGTQFIYDDENTKRQDNVVDFSHLNFNDISLVINDLDIVADAIVGEINHLELNDHSGFSLTDLKGKVSLTNQIIQVSNFQLVTPNSNLKNNLTFSFQEFDDLKDFVNRVKVESDFSKSKIDYRDLWKLIPAFRDIPNMQTDLSKTIDLFGKIKLEEDKITIDNLDTKIGNDFILQVDGSIAQLSTEPNFNIFIKKIATDYNSITGLTKDFSLPAGLQNWGRINFSGKIKGTVGDLVGSELNLSTSGETEFKGDLAMKGLPDISETLFNAKINNLSTRSEELKGFSAASFPPLLDSLGLVNFKGDFIGKIEDFKLNGNFETTAGNLGTNITMLFQKNFETAKYQGDLKMESFNLGKILGEPFSTISLSANINGEGLKLDDLVTTLNATIPNFIYKNYNYKNLLIDGSFNQKQFEGKANIKDENIAFDFLGKVDLNQVLPEVDMSLILDTINFKNLNLYKKDLGLSGSIKADLKGNNLDDLTGSASLNYFNIQQDSISYSTKEKVSLKSNQDSEGKKTLVFRSEFMDADILGQYNFREFPTVISAYVDEFFPVAEISQQEQLEEISSSSKPTAKQNFSFDLQFKDMADFTKIFVPGFSETDTAELKGYFDYDAKFLKVDGVFPNVVYNDFSADTLRIEVGNISNSLNTDIEFSESRLGSSIYLPKAKLETVFKNDTLIYSIKIWDKKTIQLQPDSLLNISNLKQDSTFEKRKLELSGNIFSQGDGYQMEFLPTLILNDEAWSIEKENFISYVDKDLIISQLGLYKDGQSILINSKGVPPKNDFSPLGINFSNFNLSEISNLLGMDAYSLDGNMTGDILLKEFKNNLHYNGDLKVDSLSFNEEHLGTLNVKTNQQAEGNIINVNVLLEGENRMTLIGDYSIQENQFDLDFDIEKLSFALVDPFINEIIKDSKGDVSGEIKLTGTPNQPNVNGLLQVRNLNTLVILSNTRYSTDLANIQVSEKTFELGTIKLKDPKNNLAILTGRINHEYFQNLKLNLNLETDAFQVLNTTLENNELYFGNLFLKANVKVTGPLELPFLDVVAKTLPESKLFVQPFIQSQNLTQVDYIIFSNPNLYNEDSLKIIEQKITKNNNGFSLALKLEVTKDAILNIIVDPETGDQLTSAGSANLTINMNALGDVSIVGNYFIEEGKYSMNYQEFLKREFDIQKGSNIIFTGDPLKAKFNIIAEYNIRTTTLELIKNETTDLNLDETSLRQNVRVLLKLLGDLEKPLVSFDIELPDNQGEFFNSSITNKLASLRETPDDLNKQVFGLLFFNSFIASDQANTQFLTNTSETLALSSVSKLLSNQLNRLADRYIKGVEVNIDLESYKSGMLQENTMTQLQLNVSKKLFNDRLSIKVGTNVNVNSADSDNSVIAGDFVLEYKINEAGNYFVRVFHKSDFNILEDANTNKTGAGIIFRKSFNGKKYKE